MIRRTRAKTGFVGNRRIHELHAKESCLRKKTRKCHPVRVSGLLTVISTFFYLLFDPGHHNKDNDYYCTDDQYFQFSLLLS